MRLQAKSANRAAAFDSVTIVSTSAAGEYRRVATLRDNLPAAHMSSVAADRQVEVMANSNSVAVGTDTMREGDSVWASSNGNALSKTVVTVNSAR